MKKNKPLWITGGIILVVLLVLGVLWLSPFSTKTLTEEELKATALTKYPGEIIRTAKSDNEYEIEVQMANGVYAIKMDTNNGNILSLKQIATEELSPSVDKLTEAQIKKEIATQGDLQSIRFINADTSYYKAVVRKENVEITLKVDPYDGSIIDSSQAPIEAHVSTESILLTEKEALTIAADHLKGIADDDAELHQPSGQTPYYLVEVEIENGDEDREAVVQVDAYTGTVKSINWEN
ncbi:PepSY domain-containing protein [Psychrobacillus sp. INOP01]|uniref:PepSY domain-containing protein n=1 Tax=Psychrobacillus sp. INOP01 TaxID=2829187 RepID=UPI001BA76DF8|nr:PepSY domain-containing protein [Psychrobacillus sp. INOP01]QUG40209.1 PepSY domain-containing protein [Psychrobacillus sp. INOP01]